MIEKKLLSTWIGALCLAAGALGQSYVPIIPPRIPEAIFAQSINEEGAVTGYFLDTGVGPTHGFVREAGGTIITFDAPISFGNPALGTTFAYSINDNGAITGSFVQITAPGVSHVAGYLRDPGGNFITFDPAGSINTQALSINAGGAVTGYYNEANLLLHGFVRAPNGKIISFDPPGSIATKSVAINANGTVAGYYQAANLSIHAFLRLAGGVFITFDPSQSTGTTVTDINTAGAVTGFFTLANGRTFGFVRQPDGTIAVFDAPMSMGVFPSSINDSGAIAGQYSNPSGLHGFIRFPDGSLATFDPPGNCSGNPAGPAVFPTGINLADVITGWCITGSPGLLSRAAWIRFP